MNIAKKKTISWIAFMLLVLFLVSVCQSWAAKVKYTDHDPPTGIRTGFVKDVWLPAIEEFSNGQIEIQDFWGGTLLGSKEVLNGVGDGITQMGFVYPGHYPGQLAVHTIFKLFPRGPAKFSDMVWFYRKVYEEVPELNEELKKANIKVLMITAGLPGAFCGTKEINSLDDIQGDKWRASGKWALRFLENAGAVPVSVPWGDIYMALQTGTIKGCFTNYDGIHMMKFDEVAPNLLVSKELWFAIPFLHVVNLDWYEKQPEVVRKALEKASVMAEEKFANIYDKAFDQIMAEQKAAGVVVTTMSEADVAKWENKSELAKLQAQWVAEAEKNGLTTAKSVMEKVRAIHQQAMER